MTRPRPELSFQLEVPRGWRSKATDNPRQSPAVRHADHYVQVREQRQTIITETRLPGGVEHHIRCLKTMVAIPSLCDLSLAKTESPGRWGQPQESAPIECPYGSERPGGSHAHRFS